MMYWVNHMGSGDWIFSILGTLITIGLIVALIVWAISPRGHHSGSATAAGGSAREILDRRLASGDLAAEQSQQLREALSDAPPSTVGSPPGVRAGARG